MQQRLTGLTAAYKAYLEIALLWGVPTAFATVRYRMHNLRLHMVRHAAINRLFDKGLSIPEVAVINGDRRLRTGTRR